jgi:hypothetical protein
VRTQVTRLILAALIATGSALSVAPVGAAASSARMEQSTIAETLRVNPGSVQIGADTVLLRPGVMTVLPSSTTMSTAAAGDPNRCPRGWTCAWTDTNFRGAMLGIREGVYTDYYYWWYNSSGAISYWPGSNPNPAVLRSFSNNASSVFNNTYNLVWAPFYSFRNKANYYAYRGAPAAYVGSKWNDSFTSACGCP